MTKLKLPTYITKLPSTGVSVEYRPFTVREEKSLLLALQEADVETINIAIKNVISSCTFEKIDPLNVPYYDIEFLFLQIRSKSIGEIIDLIGSCECSEEAKTEFSVDIADIKIEPAPIGKKTISIPDTDKIIEIRHPSIDDFAISIKEPEEISKIVANCIVSISDDEETFTYSKEELIEFVDSMTPKQQKDIANFLQEMPLVKLNTKYTCVKCKKEHNSYISGYENFFV